jgi:hypothetical protein
MNPYDEDLFTRRRPRARTTLTIGGLAALVCVSAVIQVRMPLLLPVAAGMFGGWGIVTVLRAHAQSARARLGQAGDVAAELLRIGDAERDQATAALHDHYAAGRLTRPELDDRLTAVLEAKTAAELAPLLADLPAERRPR